MNKKLKVNLEWDKNNDNLNFSVKGKNFLIDGYVARHCESVRYYACSQMTHLTKKVTSEYSDKKVYPTEEWRESNYKETVVDAILSNLQYYGIFTERTMKENGISHGQIVEEFQIPEPYDGLMKQIVDAIKKGVNCYKYNGKDRDAVIGDFANRMANDECAIIDRGWDYPATESIGLMNVNWEYIGEEWDIERGEAE